MSIHIIQHSFKRVTTLIDAGYIQIIFNCAHLDYVSSTGIGSFTAFLKAVKGKGGDIVLLSLQPKVYEVFQLLGFATFFTIHDSLETSIEFFKIKGPILLLRLLFSLKSFRVLSVQKLKRLVQVVSAVLNVRPFWRLIIMRRFRSVDIR